MRADGIVHLSDHSVELAELAEVEWADMVVGKVSCSSAFVEVSEPLMASEVDDWSEVGQEVAFAMKEDHTRLEVGVHEMGA